MSRTILPFGPQHPVFPEPIHLHLVLEDEVVKEATPTLGFVHRGLEKLVDLRDFTQMVQVCERVCGICSTIHGQCYCQAIETIMNLQVPPRAKFLRVIFAEIHRIQSHLLWMGLFADAFGFESLFMACWRIREKVMDINEATAGSRVIPSVNVIGGVKTDLTPEKGQWVLAQLAEVEKELKALEKVILNDYSVQKRTRGKGILTREKALELGAAGPTLRASGVSQDMRQLGYAAYGELGFEPIVALDGDAYSRSRVRFLETFQAAELVREAFSKLPAGDIQVKVKGTPRGETVDRVEQPRGELLYYVKASGEKHLDRLRIRTPTFANIPALLTMLPGVELADVPVIVLSIDPCVSCTER